ncbi:uncharacterized protein LOC132285563 [Cornus florida]|uniref:uncharacterized protein LOC132285563 n=1 Tax=Cornus florida TaxID=4283 RepID=UPI0028A2A1FE|nr:uncharacterized protein LOC132285563 [Cornus florida]
MEEYQSIPMERTGKILRRSIYTFFQNYQFFTTTAALLAFPFSASILLSQALLLSSSLLPTIHFRLSSLFDAAGFPPSLEFFTILNLKLSQTIASSIIVLPFTLSFLLFAKASIIQALNHQKPPLQPSFSSILSLYNPILVTQLCNSFVIISANATCFSLLFFAFNSLDAFGYSSPNSLLFLSAIGAVLYSIVLANTIIICNLALVSSGMDNKCGGYLAILKACVLIRGRTATALSLTLLVSMALAAVEALFQYRIMRPFHQAANPTYSMALEGMFIAYLYSILIVIETIVCVVFFKSCKMAYWVDQKSRHSYRIDIEGEAGLASANVKTIEDLP